MAVSMLSMSMSLDGYIAGPNDEVGNPGGDGFMRLHEWYGEDFHPLGPAGQVVDEEIGRTSAFPIKMPHQQGPLHQPLERRMPMHCGWES